MTSWRKLTKKYSPPQLIYGMRYTQNRCLSNAICDAIKTKQNKCYKNIKAKLVHNTVHYKNYHNKLNHILRAAAKKKIELVIKCKSKRNVINYKQNNNRKKHKCISRRLKLTDGSMTNEKIISKKFKGLFINVRPILQLTYTDTIGHSVETKQ